jgi:hypothetical protein
MRFKTFRRLGWILSHYDKTRTRQKKRENKTIPPYWNMLEWLAPQRVVKHVKRVKSVKRVKRVKYAKRAKRIKSI